MSVEWLSKSGVRERTLHSEPEWTRPLDWPAIPFVAHNEQVFYGLAIVLDSTSNYVTIKVSGNYTVDWGDGGATENVSSGVAALHNYSWSASGLSAVTSDGFKLALVKVTPNGGNITSIDISIKPAGVLYGYPSRWVDVFINAPSMTSLRLYQNLAGGSGSTASSHDTLFIFGLRQHSVTNFSYLLAETNIRMLSEFVTTGVTDLYYTFYWLYRLENIPILDTSSVTNMEGAFNSCHSLKSVHLTDTSLVTNFSWCFYGCMSLDKFPVIDTSAATTLSGMCANLLLHEFPDFITSACTNFSEMFSGCSNLVKAPSLDTSSGTEFYLMFYNCNNLLSVPDYDFGNALNTSNMFQQCHCLLSVVGLSLPVCTNVQGMFNNCRSLTYVDSLDVGAATNAAEMFLDCLALCYIGDVDLSSATDLTWFVYYHLPIVRCKATGIKCNVDFSGCALRATELNEIYTNLASGVTGKTIIVTDNPGVSGDNPSIATAKGWTVTG